MSKLILSNHNILSQCCSDYYHMTLCGKETKLDQIFYDYIRDIPLFGTCYDINRVYLYWGIENGLGFHDIMIINGIFY